MTVDEVLSDNGLNFRSAVFAKTLAQRATKHLRTRPYRPQTNGKAKRFGRISYALPKQRPPCRPDSSI